MIGLIRAEFRKLFTTQVWFWMLVTAVGLTVLGVVGQIAGTNSDSELQQHVRDVLTSASGAFTYVPLFVLGVLAVTTEYRYQTITPTVLTTPSRWKLITAKIVSYVVVGALYALICLVVELAIALPWLSSRNVEVSLADQRGPLVAVFLVLVLFALLGIGAGALLKNQIVAVTLGVILIVVLSNLILIIPVVKHAYPYLPTGLVSAIITSPTGKRRFNDVELLSATGGVIALLVWGFGMAVVGAGLTMNRDIS